MASKFEETRHFDKGYDELFQKTVLAINVTGFKLTKADKASGRIEAKTSFSLKSFGENILVQIAQNGNILIQSKCSAPTQLVDWGRNEENVAKFWKVVSHLLEEGQAPVAANTREELPTAADTPELKTTATQKENENIEMDFQKKQKIEKIKQEIFDQIHTIVDECGGPEKWGVDIEKLLQADIFKSIENSAGIEFVWIPPGDFLMGSSEHDSEKPIHEVKIAKPFYLSMYPVTQKQWVKVMGNSIKPSFKGDENPIERVSWVDSQTFIRRLNQMEGTNKYRLPSEAEWEYACRAGTTNRYYFGDDELKLGEYAWYNENSGRQTHPVGQKKPNSWGLYDMYGNVWEWVQDRWHSNHTNAPSDGSSWEEGNSSFRVYRGGSWALPAGICRSATRDSDDPKGCFGSLGFRIVKEI